MADILAFKKPRFSDKHKGNTLCRSGHHKWSVDTTTQFDSKAGKLVTKERCLRCGKTRTRGT